MVSPCSIRHQTGDTDSFQLVIPLIVQRDSQGTFVPCETRIVWYLAGRTSSQQLRDTTQIFRKLLMESRACAPSGPLPSACSPWSEGSGRLKTSHIGCAMSHLMKTAPRYAVATFPTLWPRYATPRLVCSGTQAMRTLRRRAVGWLPSRYKRWRLLGLNWKTK